MSDYAYDSDDFDLYDDGWLYIAEEDHLADDLAERAVASPPPGDYDFDGSGYNSDYYEYWVDIEYNSDGWNDIQGAPKTDVGRKNASGPQKRKKVAQGGPSQKKRKGPHGRTLSSGAPDSGDTPSPVIWQSRQERTKRQFQEPKAVSEKLASFALLRDWRTRFDPPAKEAKGKEAVVEMEEAPDAAAEILKAVENAAMAEEADDDEEQDGPASTEEGGGLESLIAGSGLDPQALMRALQENLAATGAAPAGLDQSTLLKYALRMFSGEDDADNIAGELAEDLFEQAEEEDPEGKNIAEWAAKQRGRPANGDKQNSAEEGAEVSESEPNSKAAALPPTPPTGQDDTSGTERKGKKKASEEPPSTKTAADTRSRKRKAAEAEPDEGPPPRPKRAARSYAAPTASSKSKAGGSKSTKGKHG